MLRLASWIAGIAGLAALGVAGCAHRDPTFPPLYPGPERAEADVAQLSGPVESVDGVEVLRKGSAFSLLPGCHVVLLPASIGEGGVGGAWSADIHDRTYAIDMMPGHSYKISVRLLTGNHSVGTANVGGVEIKAVELDGQGNRVRTLKPTRRPKVIEACRASAAAAEARILEQGEGSVPAQPKEPVEAKEPGEAKEPAEAKEPGEAVVPATPAAPTPPAESPAEQSK